MTSRAGRRRSLQRAAVGLALAAAAAPLPAAAAGTAPAPGGAAIYAATCARCHSLDANRVGPAHRGVVGRAAGSVPGFAYSPALKASRIVWTPAAIDRWLQGPQAMVPGARMFFTLPAATDRAAVIAFLAANPAK